MAYQVALCAKTIDYPEGGGHFWAYLNWALGLKAAGCRVLWTEGYPAEMPDEELASAARRLRRWLGDYGLAEAIAFVPWTDDAPPRAIADCFGPQDVVDCDLVLDMAYGLPPGLVRRCRRSALVDIDPGLLQIWMKNGQIAVAPHDLYFTISENVGHPGSAIPDLGLDWIYAPPCVALDRWSPVAGPAEAPFTTITHWWDAWMADGAEASPNDKRSAFYPYLGLPRRTELPLEIAVDLADDEEERAKLRRSGWRLREPSEVAATPEAYRRYIGASRGEFSCAKPWTVRLNTAWVSDRTLCYLASGKPAVVQDTGPSRILPDKEGLLRFRSPAEAIDRLDAVARNYAEHAEAARALAEAHFDAGKVAAHVLDVSLGGRTGRRARQRAGAPPRAPSGPLPAMR